MKIPDKYTVQMIRDLPCTSITEETILKIDAQSLLSCVIQMTRLKLEYGNSRLQLLLALFLRMDSDLRERFFLRRMGAPYIAVYIPEYVDSEINNGGFLQFYFNSAGIFREDAIVAYRTLGLNDVANVILESNKVFKKVCVSKKLIEKEKAKDWEGTWEKYRKEEHFDVFDERYYDLMKDVKLDEVMAAYIKKNPSHFSSLTVSNLDIVRKYRES